MIVKVIQDLGKIMEKIQGIFTKEQANRDEQYTRRNQ